MLTFGNIIKLALGLLALVRNLMDDYNNKKMREAGATAEREKAQATALERKATGDAVAADTAKKSDAEIRATLDKAGDFRD